MYRVRYAVSVLVTAKANNCHERYYDRTRRAVILKPGDLVQFSVSRALCNQFSAAREKRKWSVVLVVCAWGPQLPLQLTPLSLRGAGSCSPNFDWRRTSHPQCLCTASCFSRTDKLNLGPGTWGPHVEEFKRRFDPELTQGEGPQRLKNLYFTYLVELRALVKAAPYLLEVSQCSLLFSTSYQLLLQGRMCPHRPEFLFQKINGKSLRIQNVGFSVNLLGIRISSVYAISLQLSYRSEH